MIKARNYKGGKRQMKIFAIMITVAFMMISTSANADPVSKVQNWIIAEKNDIVEFQKKNWADAKDQFARNKMQIANFFSKFKTEKSN